jgi:hemerythrin superfamily protein
MDIYEALRADHRKVESLLDRLTQASQSGNDEWKTLIEQIRDDLVPHSRAEEAVFYNALREMEASKSEVTHSYLEHTMAETELRTILAMKAIDTNWKSAIEKFSNDVRHHVAEEESRVFTAARQVFSDEEARQIGEAFERLKPHFAKDSESMIKSNIDLVANLLPRRLVSSFRKNFPGTNKDESQAA